MTQLKKWQEKLRKELPEEPLSLRACVSKLTNIVGAPYHLSSIVKEKLKMVYLRNAESSQKHKQFKRQKYYYERFIKIQMVPEIFKVN